MTLVQKAKKIAREAHAGQFRRDGVTPYITHPEAVAKKLTKEHEYVIAAAWLHDVLEDTQLTAAHLYSKGIPNGVVDAVSCLTKGAEMSYEDYLFQVRYNRIALKVKIADILHNLSDYPTEKQIIKYAKGLLFLHGQ